MLLILCSPADRPALWAACGFQRRGLAIEVMSGEALVLAPAWEHRIGTDGATASTIRLHDGRVIEHSAIDGVLNRLGAVPAPSIGANEPDAAYIQQERAALLLSWLASLRNVVNSPTPWGLAGPWHSPAHSTWIASAAGLTVSTLPLSQASRSRPARLPRASIIVFDGKVFGMRAPALPLEACVAYARLAHTRLVGLEFVHTRGQWVFETATPMPDLAVGGAALLTALATAMTHT